MIKKFLLVVVLMTCIGCFSMMSVNQLEKLDDVELCRAFHNNPERIRGVLVSRDIIPYTDWPLINRNRIAMGMSVYGLICSWGTPMLGFGDVSTYTGSWGTHQQWCYDRYSHYQCAYIENGFVSGWSN